MKHLLFLLLMIPGLAQAESFKYNHLITVHEGSDNFSMDKSSEAHVAGTINIDESSIAIDNKSYMLKPMKRDNCFKYKGGQFRLVYSGKRLLYVQQFTGGKVYNYRIQHSADPARGRNAG